MGCTNAFETEFRKSLELYNLSHPNFAWHRLYDTTTFRQASEKIIGIKQPCDYIAMKGCTDLDGNPIDLDDGRTHGIYKSQQFYMLECKSSHGPTSYNLDYVKPHQITLMQFWQKAGAKCYFIINNRSVPGKHEAFIVSVDEMASAINSGVSSIRWDMMKQECLELEKIPKGDGAWNLSPLFV
jgi:hypothetical protein